MLRMSQLVLGGGARRVALPTTTASIKKAATNIGSQAKKVASSVVVGNNATAHKSKVSAVPAFVKPLLIKKKAAAVGNKMVMASKKAGGVAKKAAAAVAAAAVVQQKKDTPTVFDTNRTMIQANLAANSKDKSIRGGVDPLIAPLVDLVNTHPNYCTLSSCSGRISLFHRVQSVPGSAADKSKAHMKRGAGKGFLYVSHDPIGAKNLSKSVKEVLKQTAQLPEHNPKSTKDIYEVLQLKFEPTILHVMCRTMEDAHKLLAAANESGHRQSGIAISRCGKRVGTKAERRQLEEAKKAGKVVPEPFVSDEWKISVQMSTKVCFDAPLYDSRGGGWIVGGFEKGAASPAAATQALSRLLTVGDSMFAENARRRDLLTKLFRKF